MKGAIFGQCPYCKGHLTNGHQCPLYYNSDLKTIETKYIKSNCLKCSQPVDKINPAWLREVRRKSGITLRELGRSIKKSAPYISDVELGRRNCTKEIQGVYEGLVKP